MPDNPTITHTPYEIKVHRIERFLATLFMPGDLVELRGHDAPDGKTRRILTSDFHVAARVAVLMEHQGCNTYYCINPINPERWYAKNTLRYFRDICQHGAWKTAQDDDVKIRNTYFIDVDARREDSKVAATPEQVAATLPVARTVQAYLTDLGWPEPIVISSGNGTHLIYRADRSAIKGETWGKALGYLSKTFSTADADIDVKVRNPARLARMPWCINKKAQRSAAVLSYPAILQPVGYGMMWSLSEMGGPSSLGHATGTGTSALLDDNFDAEDLIAEFPNQFGECLNITQEGDLTYYSTSICPIKGVSHTNQPGKGHNCLIIGGPTGLGFQCLGCIGTIGDVLRLLREQTGHGYSKPIWADDDLDHSFEWWDAEHRTWVDLTDFATIFPLESADDGKPVWLEDATQLTRSTQPLLFVDDEEETQEETVIKVSCPTLTAIFQYATRAADHDVARINPAAQAGYRKEVECIIRARDYRRMAEALGQHMIDAIDPEVLTSATPPAFVDSNGDLSVIALDVLMHTDDIPLNMNVYTLDQFLASAPPTS